MAEAARAESFSPTYQPISISELAAKQVQDAMAQEGLAGHGLRVGVIGGGCSGLQYLLDFSEGPAEMDYVSEQHGVSVYVDAFSAAHLDGTVVDYVDGLSGTGFKFNNPQVVRACGCGSSFQT